MRVLKRANTKIPKPKSGSYYSNSDKALPQFRKINKKYHGTWLEDALEYPHTLDEIKCLVKLPKALLEITQDGNENTWNLYTKASGNILTAVFTGRQKFTDFDGEPLTEKQLKKWEALTGLPIEKRYNLLKGLKLYKFPTRRGFDSAIKKRLL